MVGSLGLTEAAIVLEKANRSYRRSVRRFLIKITERASRMHKNLSSWEDDEDDKGRRSDRIYIFDRMREDFMKRADEQFGEVVTKWELSHMKNHIYAITRHDFVSTTKTQIALSKKITS